MGKKQNFLARPPPPPDQNFRKKPGNFKAKLDKKENKEVESAAIARKQEPLPIKKVLLGLAAFGAVRALIHVSKLYLSDEDDIDVLMAAAAEKPRPQKQQQLGLQQQRQRRRQLTRRRLPLHSIA